MAVWPGDGPNRTRRFSPNILGLPPTRKGNIATCEHWFDYALPNQTVIMPGRAIMPTYDGYTQAGVFVGDPRFAGNKPQSGWIEGYVQANGVNLAGAWVHLYHRENGVLIASMRSNAQGYFKFTGLDPNKNNYFVLAVDPNNTYNVVVFDMITP